MNVHEVSPWFKLHAEFSDCPRTQAMSEAMQRRFIMLLCLQCRGELEKLSNDEIQYALNISPRQWAATKALFIEKGFIDESNRLVNWEKRQLNLKEQVEEQEKTLEDTTSKRQAEFAARNGNGSANKETPHAKKRRGIQPPLVPEAVLEVDHINPMLNPIPQGEE